MLSGSHCRGYYLGTLSCSQISATHFEIGHPWMKSTGVRFSNELIELQDISSGNGRQGDLPYFFMVMFWGLQMKGADYYVSHDENFISNIFCVFQHELEF